MRALGVAISAATLLAVTLGVPAAANAGGAPTWELGRYPGIDYTTFTRFGSKGYAVRVNLCEPGMRMRATKPGEGPRQVSSYGALVGADVAINGDWWAVDGGPPEVPQTTFPRGLAVGDYQAFPGLFDHPSFGVVGFGKDVAFHSVMEEALGTAAFWMQDVVSGQPTLVWDGLLRDNPNAHCGATRARTSVGFNADKTVMYLVVVQETGGSDGVTCNEMANNMQWVGAHSALNQDGGGSSTMWLRGTGVVNGLTDGSQRSLVNHWGVISGGSGPPNSCNTRVVPTAAEGVKRHVTSVESMGAWRFVNGDVRLINPDNLAGYLDGASWGTAPRVVQGSGPEVWVVDGELKRHVPSPYAMRAWRFSEAPIESVTDAELDAMPTGAVLPATPSLVLGPDLVTIYLLDVAPLPQGGGGADGGVVGGDGGSGAGGASSDGGTGQGGAGGGCAVAGAGGRVPVSGPAWLLVGLGAALLGRRRARSLRRLRG